MLPVPEAPSFGAIPQPDRNPMTGAGIALGRRLFYDPMLSDNGKVSCGSCHIQAKGFADGQRTSTLGVSGKPLLRHTPTLINVAYSERLFWDGGSTDLESQAFGPLSHPDEMHKRPRAIAAKLKTTTPYPAMFKAAFSDGITVPNIVRALAQFQRTLISDNARIDKGELTAAESEGEKVFKQKCASCHKPPLFTDDRYHNNGLDSDYPTEHEKIAWGRARITRNPDDKGKFKTPTLRNILKTAPYMHDGRFASIDDVLAHYRGGMVRSDLLSAKLVALELNEEESASLKAFFAALTDESFFREPNYSLPKSFLAR